MEKFRPVQGVANCSLYVDDFISGSDYACSLKTDLSIQLVSLFLS